MICDFGLMNWQAASVPPRAGGVLETLLRKLARGLTLRE
jgi:hypothetical protein